MRKKLHRNRGVKKIFRDVKKKSRIYNWELIINWLIIKEVKDNILYKE